MKTLGAFLLAAAAVAVTPPALAGTPNGILCEDRAKLIDGLARNFSREPVSMGLTESGTVLEILAADDGTWTMIETLPTGIACLVASGEMWRSPATAEMASHASEQAL